MALIDTQQLVRDMEYRIKLLADEKWIVGQEKTRLEGQLKQMQNMITA